MRRSAGSARRRSRSRRAVLRAVLPVAAVGLVLALVAGTTPTIAAWSNTDANTSSLTAGDVAETLGGTCVADGAAAASTSCGTTNPLPAAGASATTSVLNTGQFTSTSTLSASTCGAATITDTAAGTTVAHGGFTAAGYRAAGPLSGYGLTFDGSTTWLSTGGGGVAGPTTYTELAWFKTSTSNGATILSLANAINPSSTTSSDRFLWIDKTGHLVAGVWTTSSNEAVGTSVVNDGSWHLAAVTLSGTTLKVYVDGSLQTTTTLTGSASTYTAAWWAVGAGNESGGWADAPTLNGSNVSFFTGSLAGVAVLPSALSAANITALYGSATLAAYATTVAGYSPTHYWGLQDAAPTAAAASTAPLAAQTITYPDLSGHADTATVTGTVTTATSGPLSAGASSTFDGSSGYLTTANTATVPAAFTELAWFKDSAAGGNQPMIFLGDNHNPTAAGAQDHVLYLDGSGQVVGYVFDNPTTYFLASPATYTDGGWHLAALTLSATAGTTVYVDGTAVVSNAAATSAASYASGYWSLGDGGSAFSPFNGSIAGAAVIPSALSAGQIASLYSSATFAAYSAAVLADTPTVYWPLTSPAETHPDLSGNADTATSYQGVWASPSGPLSAGSATAFDGSTGAITTATSVTGPTTYTELVWFKTSTAGGVILSWSNSANPLTSTPTHFDRFLWIDNTGHLVGSVYGSSEANAVGATVVTDGAWHLAAVTVSAAGLKLYLDGTLDASNAAATSSDATSGWWTIGSAYTGSWADAPTTKYFTGTLAGVAVLPTALSQAQLSALHSSATFAAYSGTVLTDSPSQYWSLVTQANACTSALVTASLTISGTTTCILPALASGTACPTVSSGGLPLLDLTYLNVPSTVTSAVGTTATLTVTIADYGSLSSPVTGTDTLIDATLTATAHGWTAAATYPHGQTVL